MPVLNERTAIGIVLPLERGPTGYFKQSYDIKTQVKSNLINLILTRKRERIMQPAFGCDIQDYLFEQITDDVVAGMRGAITDSINTWLPYIQIENMEVVRSIDDYTVTIKLFYSIRNYPNIFDSVTFVFPGK